MSVQTNDAAGQAPGAGTPQSGQDPTAQQGQQGAGQQQQGQAPGQQTGQFDLESITDPAVRAYVETQMSEARRARAEAANYRTQYQGLQRKNETADEAAQREAQERQERLDRLEQENRTLKVGQALASAAKDAHNPSVVASMIAPQVTLDEQGKPTNVDALVSALRASDPYLFKVSPGGADAGAGNDPGASPAAASSASAVNDLIRQKGRGAAPSIR